MEKHDELARRVVPSAGSEYPISTHGYVVAVGHAADVLRAEAPVLLTTDDLHRLRQWFNLMEDTNSPYIEPGDRALYQRILAALRERSEWK